MPYKEVDMLSSDAHCKYNENGYTHNATVSAWASGSAYTIEYWDGHIGKIQIRHFNPAEFLSLVARGQIWHIRDNKRG